MKDSKKTEEGITVKKAENFSEWYTQVLQKAELMDYTAVSGSIVMTLPVTSRLQSVASAAVSTIVSSV